MNIARAHFSQEKIVLDDLTNSFENWATDGTYIKFNRDTISSTTGIG